MTWYDGKRFFSGKIVFKPRPSLNHFRRTLHQVHACAHARTHSTTTTFHIKSSVSLLNNCHSSLKHPVNITLVYTTTTCSLNVYLSLCVAAFLALLPVCTLRLSSPFLLSLSSWSDFLSALVPPDTRSSLQLVQNCLTLVVLTKFFPGLVSQTTFITPFVLTSFLSDATVVPWPLFFTGTARPLAVLFFGLVFLGVVLCLFVGVLRDPCPPLSFLPRVSSTWVLLKQLATRKGVGSHLYSWRATKSLHGGSSANTQSQYKLFNVSNASPSLPLYETLLRNTLSFLRRRSSAEETMTQSEVPDGSPYNSAEGELRWYMKRYSPFSVGIRVLNTNLCSRSPALSVLLLFLKLKRNWELSITACFFFSINQSIFILP